VERTWRLRKERGRREGEKWEFSICEGEKEKMRKKINGVRMVFFFFFWRGNGWVRVSSAAFNSDVFVKRFKFQISMWELECIKLCV
jgi:hypothetical protein